MRLLVGPYVLEFPNEANASVRLCGRADWAADSLTTTVWSVDVLDHTFFISLSVRALPVDLGMWITQQTRKPVSTEPVEFGSVSGQRYGEFHEFGAFVDWWLRGTGPTIQITLRSELPPPLPDIQNTLEAIVASIAEVSIVSDYSPTSR
ncbi:hypothetical protein [uncultured Maricaulis sp.]|uniref:hypothetical protein n=1 Tax=uncultured Maricaulis sp. TaxID=174710 RepID=UPI0030D85C87|tara:strand:+ start:68850 stop:69296 length:447 start_codon:yes stop_codon:yes gene_type:complete